MKTFLLAVVILAAFVPAERLAWSEDAAPTSVQECSADPAVSNLNEVDGAALGTAGMYGVTPKESTRSRYTSHGLTDELYVAIGPDGKMLGTIPATIREDAHIVVAVFETKTLTYDVSITGCTQLSTRVLGQAPKPAAEKAPEKSSAELYVVGHCSADKPVTIEVKLSAASCTAKTVTTTVQTSSVYNFTVGYGIAFFGGYRNDVGVDTGVGGAPSVAFQRRVRRGVQDRLLVAWFPLGYAPTTSLFERDRNQNTGVSFLRHVSIGTFIDVSNATSSFNLNLGVEIVQGMQVFLGADFCDKETTLAGGLHNGSVFGDDSSKLPTTSSVYCHTEAYFGIAGTADLVGKLFK